MPKREVYLDFVSNKGFEPLHALDDLHVPFEIVENAKTHIEKSNKEVRNCLGCKVFLIISFGLGLLIILSVFFIVFFLHSNEVIFPLIGAGFVLLVTGFIMLCVTNLRLEKNYDKMVDKIHEESENVLTVRKMYVDKVNWRYDQQNDMDGMQHARAETTHHRELRGIYFAISNVNLKKYLEKTQNYEFKMLKPSEPIG